MSLNLSQLWELVEAANWPALSALLLPIVVPFVTGTLTPLACRKVIGPVLAWSGGWIAAAYRGVALLLRRPLTPLAQRVLDMFAEHCTWDATSSDGDGQPALVRLGEGSTQNVQALFDARAMKELTIGFCSVLPQLSRRERKLVSAAALTCLRGVTNRQIAGVAKAAGRNCPSCNNPFTGDGNGKVCGKCAGSGVTKCVAAFEKRA